MGSKERRILLLGCKALGLNQICVLPQACHNLNKSLAFEGCKVFLNRFGRIFQVLSLTPCRSPRSIAHLEFLGLRRQLFERFQAVIINLLLVLKQVLKSNPTMGTDFAVR